MSRFSLPELPQTVLVKVGMSVLACAIALGLFFVWLNGQKREAVNDYKVETEAKASDARETAADERVKDAVKDTKYEGDLHNAINKTPPRPEAKLSDAELALNCERLRKRGRIPPACRPEGSGGTQSGTD